MMISISKTINNGIESYVTIGKIPNGIEVSDEKVPNNFFEEFLPNKFLYVDGNIVLNESYKQEDSESYNWVFEPSPLALAVEGLSRIVFETKKELSDTKSKLKELESELTKHGE